MASAAFGEGLSRVVVPGSLHGERADRGLALLSGMTRSQAARLVSAGHVKVGAHTLSSGSRKLNKGEVLEVDVPEGSLAVPAPFAVPSGAPVPEATVIYADADIVVVDKPAGLVVHPGAGHPAGTLVDQLLAEFPDMAGTGTDGQRPGIVHRIDKGTSGLLMVARNPAAYSALVAQLSSRAVERRYLAIVHGEVEADEGIIDAPLGRSQRDRVKVSVMEGGRSARTRYRAVSRATVPLEASLLTCRLETGRTHQIRAHMTAIGHPVLLDERYAKARLLAAARLALPWLERPWLHAAYLGFKHPGDGRAMSFASSLPEDLARCLPVLGLKVPSEPAEAW